MLLSRRPILRQRARSMRRECTEPERRLWLRLRKRQVADMKFRRQSPVGPYIADFLCLAACLVVEVDGDTHADPRTDAARDRWMQSQRCQSPPFLEYGRDAQPARRTRNDRVPRYFTSSLRTSTTRIMQATMMPTNTTSTIALAEAGGYCMAWISVDSADTIEALWPPLICLTTK